MNNLRQKISHLLLSAKLAYGKIKSRVETDPRFIDLSNKLKSNKHIILLRWRLSRIHPALGRNFFQISIFLATFLIVFSFFYGLFWRAPRPFPEYTLISVEKGKPLGQIAQKFEEEGVVLSSFWLRAFIFMDGGERRVIAGDYYIPQARNVFSIARMLTEGEFGLTAVRVSIPEGLNAEEMAEVIGKALPKFNKREFIIKGKENEGYLFPDTYFLMQNARPEELIAMMRENFTRKIEPYQADIEKFKKPFEEDLIVASIVEDEVSNIDDKRIVAGIIWKRLRMGMPLQVDSTLRYVNGRASHELTKDDLADDNPYNTYKNKGLPPTPISNPGIDSIRASITPTNTKYLYFLSDKHGKTHYAATFEEHKRNRELYLD